MKKVVHITSVHSRYDVRIFIKMCQSLSNSGKYEVVLLVADGLGDEQCKGIRIVDVGKPQSRIERLFVTSWKLLKAARNSKADIYHLHDPELMLIGLVLIKQKLKVIFDAHEDLPKQIYSKYYLKKWVKPILSGLVLFFEKIVSKKFTYIVAATPAISEKFEHFTPRVFNINNYPLVSEFTNVNTPFEERKFFSYIGGITRERGVKEMILASQLLKKGRLKLAGSFVEEELHEALRESLDWSKVDELGYISREEVKEVLGASIAGLVTLLPTPNHMNALPNKMFEYMSAGIPIVASNFPLWQQIVEGVGCGICVNPENPQEIADAMNYLIMNPQKAYEMGKNGSLAVQEKYNWQAEEEKLMQLYKMV